MGFSDRMLTCRDCGVEFLFSGGEQEFFQLKGLLNEPGRCPTCRSAYKRARGIEEPRSDREVYMATCSQCGGEARLPFSPTKERPVYCSSCFDVVRQHQANGQAVLGVE